MRLFPVLSAVVVSCSVLSAAAAERVDFKDPKRAVGREDNIRIDAQLADDSICTNVPLSVTYQIENLTSSSVAIADKVVDADFDMESRTITVSLGAEVPSGNAMPHMAVIKPGEKRVFSVGAYTHFVMPSVRTPFSPVPRFVQFKVSVLRDLAPFARLIENQSAWTVPPALTNDLFDRWVEGSASVFLNALPIHWKADSRGMSAESNRLAPAGGTF